MKPTVQNPDFYAVGNDYAQAPISAFYDVDTKWDQKSLCEAAGIDEADFSAISGNVDTLIGQPRFYQDGIYTKLADNLVSGDFSATDPWKDPNGFNKRTILVDPAAKYSDETYGQADVIFNVGETDNEETRAASATYGTNDQFPKVPGPDAPKPTKKAE